MRRDAELKPTARLDLLRGGRQENEPLIASEPRTPPPGGLSRNELVERYEAICRARAIYYPVAFQFRRGLGRGRQGRVFLGLRQGARGCVTEHAIKVFDPSIYTNPEEYWTDMGRIASQISQLQRMQSPNLVFRHSYEETNGIGYSQMEAIDGLDLRRLLLPDHFEQVHERSTEAEWRHFRRTLFQIEGKAFSLKPGVVVYILRSALRGLESLHSMNFLHSDVKPGNIMIDRLGSVKLVDFGRAVLTGERLSFLLGSPLYMAPESHRRETAASQADFYSLGLVALEMLRGRILADEPDPSEEDLLAAKMALPSSLPGLLPRDVRKNRDLVAILRRFLEPDPSRRFSSAREAEIGDKGLRPVDNRLVRAGLDSEYARDLADYLAKLVDIHTNRIESSGQDPHPSY